MPQASNQIVKLSPVSEIFMQKYSRFYYNKRVEKQTNVVYALKNTSDDSNEHRVFISAEHYVHNILWKHAGA